MRLSLSCWLATLLLAPSLLTASGRVIVAGGRSGDIEKRQYDSFSENSKINDEYAGYDQLDEPEEQEQPQLMSESRCRTLMLAGGHAIPAPGNMALIAGCKNRSEPKIEDTVINSKVDAEIPIESSSGIYGDEAPFAVEDPEVEQQVEQDKNDAGFEDLSEAEWFIWELVKTISDSLDSPDYTTTTTTTPAPTKVVICKNGGIGKIILKKLNGRLVKVKRCKRPRTTSATPTTTTTAPPPPPPPVFIYDDSDNNADSREIQIIEENSNKFNKVIFPKQNQPIGVSHTVNV